MSRIFAIVATLALIPALAMAGPKETVRAALAKLAPGTSVSRVEETPVDGLYAAVVGSEVFYITGDGAYLIQGELVDIAARRSLTEQTRARLRLSRLEKLGENRMLIYDPPGKVEHEVTVFTDIDCPYCRRLHEHINGYLARGIRVRYLLMPRAGRNSRSYEKSIAVWCADDPHAALTHAMAGKNPPSRECGNPVDEHMAIARAFGVRATPTMVTANGRLTSGYRTPDQLEALLSESGH